MKKILGLDIGVSSVGLAVTTKKESKTNIEHMSVRIVPEDPDFHGKFYSGNTASKNLARTEKRGIRRNNQRFKSRRDRLCKILKEHSMFPNDGLFLLKARELYEIRSKAVTENLSLQELGRVLILLNQRRGFLSNRKSISDEENSTEFKERMAELEKALEGKTIGQKLFEELNEKKHPHEVLLRERTYQRSSYLEEFDRIWDCQKKHHDQLTGGPHEEDNKGTLYDLIRDKTIYYQRPLKSQKGLVSDCLFEKHHKATTKSSPYFELYRIWQKVNDLSWKTPDGQKIEPSQEQKNDLKKTLWTGTDLNAKHKLTISKIKSQKGLVSDCLFEKHHKATTKSSPYFELHRIWQKVNDLSWKTPDGQKIEPSQEQKNDLKKTLWTESVAKSKFKLTISKIKSTLGFSTRGKIYLNFTELDGSRTYSIIKTALEKAEIPNPEQYLFFNPEENDEKGGLFELWHITYSLPTEKEVVNTLMKRFGFSLDQSIIISKNVGYTSDYGSLSTRAIKKLLPHFEKGFQYSEACDKVGYDHSGYKTEIEIKSKLKPVPQNSLRNPVVEQILNQVVNMVNMANDEFGPFDEIRVELARELRNSAKTRARISKSNASNKRDNDSIRTRLKEYGFKLINGRDVQRYKLWEETKERCLYCSNPIGSSNLLNGTAETEHILPKSRSFSNAASNYIIAHRKCNSDKGQMTAYDFMASKGEEALHQYISKVNALYNDGKGTISKAKFENLLTQGDDIPSDFVERMKKDTQYISKASVAMLKTICANTYTTTGQVTDVLRKEWELTNLLQELNYHKYEAIDQIETREHKNQAGGTKSFQAIKDWSKRDDHRHHAIDALICALTDQKIIFKLNNLNKIFQYERDALSQEEINVLEKELEHGFTLKDFVDQQGHIIECPVENIRAVAKKHLDELFISFKKDNGKVLTKNINRPKNSTKTQPTWVPRARLHEETVMGRIKRIAEKKIKINDKFAETENVVNPHLKLLLQERLSTFNNDPKLAFSTKSRKKHPLTYKNQDLKEVAVYEEVNTKRVVINENITSAQVEKVIDNKIKSILCKRLELHNNKFKKAFKNLAENPIWLDQSKGLQIKSVTVYDESKVIPTSTKKDVFGKTIYNHDGHILPTGYVKTGGNHHALIYKDPDGKYNDKVVSFWKAVGIGLANIEETHKPYPIINKENDPELGAFQFSMQRNDLFVFDLKHTKNPQEEKEIDFTLKKNRKQISDKLFRAQILSQDKNGRFIASFRHHLETQVVRKDREGKAVDESNLKGIAWEKISKNSDLSRLTKIRINHLGQIVKIGE